MYFSYWSLQSTVMNCHPILCVFLLCAQCFHDQLWIHLTATLTKIKWSLKMTEGHTKHFCLSLWIREHAKCCECEWTGTNTVVKYMISMLMLMLSNTCSPRGTQYFPQAVHCGSIISSKSPSYICDQEYKYQSTVCSRILRFIALARKRDKSGIGKWQ